MTKSTIIAILGPIITIVSLGGTMLYTQGGIEQRVIAAEEAVDDNRIKIQSNQAKTQTLEVQQGSIESKLDLLITMMEEM